MGDPGAVGPEAIQKMRDEVERQSAQVAGAGDPNDLQLSAAARHVAAQLARAEGRHKDPADLIEPGEVVMVADGQEVRPRATSTAKSKGLRIVEECLATGEPFFVFRAHDIFSNMVLVQYAKLLEDYGPDDVDMLAGVVDQLGEFKEWQKNHPRLVKYPD